MLAVQLLTSILLMVTFILVSRATAWNLRSDPQVVDLAMNHKVEIFCYGSSESLEPFSLVKSVQITKLDSYGVSQILASINFGTSKVWTKDANFNAYNYSYGLGIESTNVTRALGTYGCVIIGLDNLNQVIHKHLHTIVIKAKQMTIANVYVRLRQIQKKLCNSMRNTKSEISSIKDTMSYLNKSSITYMSKDVEKISTKLDTCLKDLCEGVNKTQEKKTDPRPRVASWPKGRYGLYMPISGCPSSAWNVEWVQFETESPGLSRDNASSGNHFPKPLFFRRDNQNIANLRYCIHSDEMSSASWPNGSYCIKRASGVCPARFQSSAIQLDLEDENVWYNYTTHLDVTFNQDFVFLNYCCRNDSEPTSPMALPVNKPFYLYRFGGTCQEVKDMAVRHEYMTIVSEEEDNDDQFTGDIHPDATLNPVTLHLCYYSNTN